MLDKEIPEKEKTKLPPEIEGHPELEPKFEDGKFVRDLESDFKRNNYSNHVKFLNYFKDEEKSVNPEFEKLEKEYVEMTNKVHKDFEGKEILVDWV